MKFLFTHFIKYHEQWFEALGHELRALGHEVEIIDRDLKTAERFVGADVVMEINCPRDEAIPRSAAHVAWIQDYMVGTVDYDSRALPQDVIFTLGHGPQIGVPCAKWKNYRGSFLPAVAEELFDLPPVEPEWDLSLVGYITEPFVVWEDKRMNVRIPVGPPLDDIIAEVMAAYRPLRGEFDQKFLVDELARRMEEAIPGVWEKMPRNPIGFIVHQMARTYDRMTVARMMLQVSDQVAFYGHHWDEWVEFASHAHSFAEEPVEIYRQTKLNVHNNVFGFALHSRVLEAMAVGGFVMAHATPHYGMAGQMTECFVPYVHFGEYTKENFVEQARQWLQDDKARKYAAAEARKVVKDRHLWKHRAAQLLKELS